MGKLLEAVQGIRTAIKLRRGQCDYCHCVLPDNGYRWCSDECHDEYQDMHAV